MSVNDLDPWYHSTSLTLGLEVESQDQVIERRALGHENLPILILPNRLILDDILSLSY